MWIDLQPSKHKPRPAGSDLVASSPRNLEQKFLAM